VPPRPDNQSFTKFVLSAGAFLVVAAFVVPGLVLRDTGVLELSKRELKDASTVARPELERRQQIATDSGHAVLPAGIVLFVFGCGLIGFSLPRLWQQEKRDDERAAFELGKLRREFEPQSEDEKEERIKAEAAEERAASSVADPDPPRVPPGNYFPDEVRERARLELAVLQRIGEIAPASYEFQSQVKTPGSPSLRLDGLLISKIDQHPDIVVEVKVSRLAFYKNLMNRMADQAARLMRYRNRFRRDSIAWLILVTDEPLNARQRAQLDDSVGEFGSEIKVSAITPETIDALSFPI
jgi:hypothetical protein